MELRNSGTQELRNSGTQELRKKRETKKLRSSCLGIPTDTNGEKLDSFITSFPEFLSSILLLLLLS
jgi:hypothetical protein